MKVLDDKAEYEARSENRKKPAAGWMLICRRLDDTVKKWNPILREHRFESHEAFPGHAIIDCLLETDEAMNPNIRIERKDELDEDEG